jgi:RNA polymerase sigma-70 factor
MSPEEITQYDDLLAECEPVMDEIFARCGENAPNFGVRADCFKDSLRKSVRRYLLSNTSQDVPAQELKDFLRQIQADDLFMALACANGSERAWWEFDQQHRAYLERVARHLASTEIDAQEVIDTVYVELYGTRVVDGERVSKFATYSGRGSLRGWLRTVIWHSLVDLHRASHDEVSLDEMTETVGEGYAHASFAIANLGGEDEMIDQIAKDRYRKATLNAIENAFAALDNHEKLLLLYYHVENLKLREIARLVENADSPLRGWFQRKSAAREQNPSSRIHESTIMRWLEKCYAKVLKIFRNELQTVHNLGEKEIEICMELATQDLASSNLYRNLTAT